MYIVCVIYANNIVQKLLENFLAVLTNFMLLMFPKKKKKKRKNTNFQIEISFENETILEPKQEITIGVEHNRDTALLLKIFDYRMLLLSKVLFQY